MKKFVILVIIFAAGLWIWSNYFSEEARLEKKLETQLQSTNYASQKQTEEWLGEIDFTARVPTEIPKGYYGRAATGLPQLAGIKTKQDAITFSYLSTKLVILDIYEFPAEKVHPAVLDYTMAGDGLTYDKKEVKLADGIIGYLEYDHSDGHTRNVPPLGRVPVSLKERRLVFVTNDNLAVLIRNIALEDTGDVLSEKKIIKLANSLISDD